MKRNLILTLLAILFTCCTSSNKQMVDKHTTIDSTWQKQCTTILSDKMQELDALYGDVIIMECKTGEIKAMGCLAKDSKGNLVGSNRLAQATGLMRSVSLLAALESGKINVDDHVDTKNGVIQLNNNLLRDHNWRRGGYGKITIQNGFLKSSILSTYLTIEKAFGKQYASYCNMLDKMGYGLPKSIEGMDNLKEVEMSTPNNDMAFAQLANGMHQQISSVQLLTFYNAIANGGTMVQPTLQKNETTITIKDQMTSKENITLLQRLLSLHVADGMSKKVASKKVGIAGDSGVTTEDTNMEDALYTCQFCGYYPSDAPQYSIIVTLNRKGIPASGAMPCEVAKEIIEATL